MRKCLCVCVREREKQEKISKIIYLSEEEKVRERKVERDSERERK